MLDEAARRRAAPLRVARREVLADVARAGRAEHRVDHRVQRDVGVAVPGEAAVVRRSCTPHSHSSSPSAEAVHVEAGAGARDSGQGARQ